MQVGEQCSHLFPRKAAGERRHHSFPRQYSACDVIVGSGNAAWQRGVFENAVEVWRYFLQRQVVVFVAVSAASGVELLPCCLLIREASLTVATIHDDC